MSSADERVGRTIREGPENASIAVAGTDDADSPGLLVFIGKKPLGRPSDRPVDGAGPRPKIAPAIVANL
jgi:hypothetical protein